MKYKLIEYKHYEGDRVGTITEYKSKNELNAYIQSLDDLLDRGIIHYTMRRKNNIVTVDVYF